MWSLCHDSTANIICLNLKHNLCVIHVRTFLWQFIVPSYSCKHADAVRDIHSRIPDDLQLYHFGTSPCLESPASSLMKELQGSSLKPPAADDTQSFDGKCFNIYFQCFKGAWKAKTQFFKSRCY